MTLSSDNNSSEYEYDYGKFIQIAPDYPDPDSLKYPMATTVFYEENTISRGEWARGVASALLRVRANQTLYDIAIEKKWFAPVQFIVDFLLLRFVENPQNPEQLGRLYALLLGFIRAGSPDRSARSASPQQSGNMIGDAVMEKTLVRSVKTIQQREKRDRQIPRSTSRGDYRNLFQLIYLPVIAWQEQDDRVFAQQRVAGVNPLVIERLMDLPALLKRFPITEEQYQSVMSNDSLQQAFTENRLYITDYQVLKDIEPGQVTLRDGVVNKFVYQPIALFAFAPGDSPQRRLTPVAIQCYQQPAADNPIFISPDANALESKRWAWKIAKLTVQIADANYHEFISHLGGTHLWMEPIAISIYRKLPASSPLGALLRPHIEGTLFINDSALKGLVNAGGTVDKVSAGTLVSSLLLSLEGAKQLPFSFNESFLPMTFKNRGVDDPKAFPDYPFRDDSLLIWEAIHEWVTNYLTLFYPSDILVQQDDQIQEWFEDLTSANGGQVMGIGEFDGANGGKPQIRTLAYLIEMVTLIIFTGSAKHAAVNFPQAAFLTYAPNMPLAGYKHAPTSSLGITRQHFIETLPSLEQAETQMNMTYLLGSVYYTHLGEYDKSCFGDSDVLNFLEEFQDKLVEIERIIHKRNESRSTYYDTLLPSKIPQSINI
jgi:arachidonate 15-lipoxygenase